MKIEIGKRYIRRDGSVTPVLTEDFEPGTTYAYDSHTGYVYGTRGEDLDHQVFSYETNSNDLMEEYVE